MKRNLLAATAQTIIPVFLCAASSAIAANRADTRPNFVLCMADDQGWGDMAYNGHPALKTPTFDQMSREGLRFDRFYAAAPVCSPTRPSVMTGRTPNRQPARPRLRDQPRRTGRQIEPRG